MADFQESGNSEFLEGSFLGTPTPAVRNTIKTPGIVIPEILTFLAEEQSIEPTTGTSSTGSVHFEVTPDQIQEDPAPSPVPSPVVISVATTAKDVVIDNSENADCVASELRARYSR
jgi:hypothetical protein